MKLAVCISGQPRMFKKSYESIKSHILDKYDCDLYIFSWKKEDSSKIDKFNSWRYQDEGTLEEYINLYNPKAYLIEKYTDEIENQFIKEENKYGFIREDNPVRRYLAMLYGIYQANQLSDDKGNYDYIIRTRPDILYNGFQLPKTNIMIDHYGNGRTINSPGDVFACGIPVEMEIYSSLYYNVQYHFKEDGIIPNTEILLEHHLRKFNINWQISHYVDKIIRPPNWNL